jgi:hypothetical protein
MKNNFQEVTPFLEKWHKMFLFFNNVQQEGEDIIKIGKKKIYKIFKF